MRTLASGSWLGTEDVGGGFVTRLENGQTRMTSLLESVRANIQFTVQFSSYRSVSIALPPCIARLHAGVV